MDNKSYILGLSAILITAFISMDYLGLINWRLINPLGVHADSFYYPLVWLIELLIIIGIVFYILFHIIKRGVLK